jgi:23S rRNA pseudouridine1911/1915/1917 synthase
MAEERALIVPDSLAGARVDQAISRLLGVSRAQARDLVESGVTLDGEPVTARRRVASGSVIVTPPAAEAKVLEAEPVDFEVLYEDLDVIVIDKPVGVVVHPGAGRSQGTLAAGLLHRYPELDGVGQAGRWGLVHRLDKDTSGALVVARNDESYQALVAQIRNRHMKRVYVALVHGLVGSATGTIDAPIGRDPTHPTRRAVIHDGKPARTHYEVVSVFTDATLLRVALETGRTHQIRVHLAAIEHPIVGDTVYDPRPRRISSPRVFLHAAEVELAHPKTGDVLTVTSPLPADLTKVLDALG